MSLQLNEKWILFNVKEFSNFLLLQNFIQFGSVGDRIKSQPSKNIIFPRLKIPHAYTRISSIFSKKKTKKKSQSSSGSNLVRTHHLPKVLSPWFGSHLPGSASTQWKTVSVPHDQGPRQITTLSNLVFFLKNFWVR